jgi:uncharacterized protein (DUF4415 family)
MATVKMTLNPWDTLSPESVARLAALKDRAVDTSDIPEPSADELKEMARQARELRKKKMFSLRIENGVIAWWRWNLGEGYTTVMAKLLEEAAVNHPEWIKECLQNSGSGTERLGGKIAERK